MKNLISLFLIFLSGVLLGRLSTLLDETPAPQNPTAGPPGATPPTRTALASASEHNHLAKQTVKQTRPEPETDSVLPTLLPEIVDFIPEESVETMLSLIIPRQELEGVGDIKAFAKRYLEEINLKETDVDDYSFASVIVSTSKDDTFGSSSLEIKPSDRVYAHVQFSGGLGTGSDKVLSRWVNLDNREVLFFKRSHINPDGDNNWVSFTPSGGWKTGNYEVAFYLLANGMKKVGSTNFFLSIKET